MKPNHELVSFADLSIAYERWKSVNPDAPYVVNKPHQHPWMTFLGVQPPEHYLHGTTNDRPYDSASYWVPSKGARKVRLLNGPHWETLLKIWQLQEASTEETTR